MKIVLLRLLLWLLNRNNNTKWCRRISKCQRISDFLDHCDHRADLAWHFLNYVQHIKKKFNSETKKTSSQKRYTEVIVWINCLFLFSERIHRLRHKNCIAQTKLMQCQHKYTLKRCTELTMQDYIHLLCNNVKCKSLSRPAVANNLYSIKTIWIVFMHSGTFPNVNKWLILFSNISATAWIFMVIYKQYMTES